MQEYGDDPICQTNPFEEAFREIMEIMENIDAIVPAQDDILLCMETIDADPPLQLQKPQLQKCVELGDALEFPNGGALVCSPRKQTDDLMIS